MSQMLNVGKNGSMYTNLVAYDNYGQEGVVFLSAFGNASDIPNVAKDLNKKTDIYAMGRYYRTNGKYETVSSRLQASDYVHMIGYRKDELEEGDDNSASKIKAFMFWQDDQDMSMETLRDGNFSDTVIDKLYDKLYKLSPVPFIKDWTSYVLGKMVRNGDIREMSVYCSDPDINFHAFAIELYTNDLQNYISTGLAAGDIVIERTSNAVSSVMSEVVGLDSYLNTFRDTLARRIQDSFIPRFIPGRDEYSQELKDLADYESYMGKLSLFDAQKGVIQAASNALNNKKVAFIIGEPGSGKTAMATSTVCVHNANHKTMTNVVMCPGHLVEKWKKEIERLAPLSEAIILSDFDELLDLVPKIKDKNRRRHLWIVMSKESAKFGYQERPSAVWRAKKSHYHGEHMETYCCPECGQPLYTVKVSGKGRYRTEEKVYFNEMSFAHKTAENAFCMNKVKRWNAEEKKYDLVPCGAKLWEAVGKELGERDGLKSCSRWVNLGAKVGWIEEDKVQKVFDRIMESDKATKEETAMLPALSDAINGDIPAQRVPIKYPLGKFFRRYLKGCIDYFLADEVHELKAKDSLQGQAFADLIQASCHTLCFTGTLLNGYASGIFYILFRAFPGFMKQEGFTFDAVGENEFVRQYGKYRKIQGYSVMGGIEEKKGSARIKQLPGVSPIVFTKFLLENAVFISLEDIGDGLPGYEEIPVPVDMDAELAESYGKLERDIHDSFTFQASGARGGMKTLGQMIQTLTIYPDQPYDQPTVYHPDTGEVVVTPDDLSKDVRRNKDARFLELVRERVDAGEKVLVYYNWTNRTDLGKRIPRMLEEEGIKAATMTSSVKARDRERWIEDKVKNDNIDVLVCNPSLVETGLDLLDFTTIIFYQIGYNLFTLRQASRRSWRLSQTKDVRVYFLFYRSTVQEQALSLMASKLQAAMAIEGKFSEDGLNAMSNGDDLLTQIASSVAEGIKDTVDAQVFSSNKVHNTQVFTRDMSRNIDIPREHIPTIREKIGVKRRKNFARAINSSELEVLQNPGMLLAAF